MGMSNCGTKENWRGAVKKETLKIGNVPFCLPTPNRVTSPKNNQTSKNKRQRHMRLIYPSGMKAPKTANIGVGQNTGPLRMVGLLLVSL